MKNDRKEDVFVARRLGRTYDVSGRSSMTSFMDDSTVLVCWDFSHWYEWSLCIVFGAMKWWMVAVGDEILAHVFKFVECRNGRCGRVVKIDVVEPRYKVNDHFWFLQHLLLTTTSTPQACNSLHTENTHSCWFSCCRDFRQNLVVSFNPCYNHFWWPKRIFVQNQKK